MKDILALQTERPSSIAISKVLKVLRSRRGPMTVADIVHKSKLDMESVREVLAHLTGIGVVRELNFNGVRTYALNEKDEDLKALLDLTREKGRTSSA